VSYLLETSGTLHLFFILIPIWIFATLLYCGLAYAMGAKNTYSEQAVAESAEAERKSIEAAYLKKFESNKETLQKESLSMMTRAAFMVSYLALFVCACLGIFSYINQNIELVRTWLIVPTLIYFVTATFAYLQKSKVAHDEPSADALEQELAASKY
jgi:NCS1 family nucleobase:cation symporter-1